MSGATQELPPGWAWKTMGEIADVIGGGTPRTSDSANFDGGTIPWITPADLSGHTSKYIGSGARSITQNGLDNSSARMMPAGTVLFTSRAPIGYVAIASNPVCTNQGFKSFVLKGDVLPDYAYWWLKGSKQLAEGMASGTTFLELSGAKAKQLSIPIAPPDEQKRIVAEIEKQFSRLDEAVANLNRIKANLKRYKAAVLKAAVEGRLVETEAVRARREGRGFETGEQLLKRILESRRNRWQGPSTDREPLAPETGSLSDLPDGWVWATVDQLAVVVRGASPRPAGDPRFFGGSIPWITVGPLTANDQPYLISVTETVTKEGRDRSRYIEPETLLLTNSGATLGVPKITRIGGCINDGVAALLHVDYPLKLYLLNFLRLQTQRLRRINQGAAQPNLNTTIIKELCVPLPPAAEQTRINLEIDRQLSLFHEQWIDGYIARTRALRRGLLNRAFTGQLFSGPSHNHAAPP